MVFRLHKFQLERHCGAFRLIYTPDFRLYVSSFQLFMVITWDMNRVGLGLFNRSEVNLTQNNDYMNYKIIIIIIIIMSR